VKRLLLWGVGGVAGLIALAVIGLFVASQREGAGRNFAAVEIARPPETVYPFFLDLNVFKGWVGWTEVQVAEPGELKVGSKFHVIVVNEGNRIEMDGEVTALEPNREIGLKLVSTHPQYKFTEAAKFTIAEVSPGKSRVEMLTDTQYQGFLALMEPLISGAAQKRLDADVLRLKGLAEK
jgi:uncharacterized protein YndB with AHSA1/START domain